MFSLIRRVALAALPVASALGFLAAIGTPLVSAGAVLGRPHAIERPLPVTTARSGTAFVHAPFAPLSSVRSAMRRPEITALPLIPAKHAVNGAPLMPLFAPLVPASAWSDCPTTQSRFMLSTLPTTPVALPAPCLGDRSDASQRDGLRALGAGHDKNALYGPAYSPQYRDIP